MTTLVLQPDATAGKDAYLDKTAPTTNRGSLAFIYMGEVAGASDYTRRGIIQFDLSSIDSGSTVTSATLELYCYDTSSDATNNRTFRVYRLKRAWTEAGVTWNKYDGTNDWQTAGGFGSDDCEQTSIGSCTYTQGAASGWRSYSLTAASVAAMCGATPSFTNNGFLIKSETELDDGYRHRSSDYTTDASLRPKLTIEYTENVENIEHNMSYSNSVVGLFSATKTIGKYL